MPTNHVEIETKYDVDEELALPALERANGVASVTGPVQHELEATYYDTAELDLARAGITLRRRTGGDDAGWHLKLPLADARQEVRVPLGRAVRTAPKQLRSLVQATVRDRPLAPVVCLRTARSVWSLLDASGTTLAEVCDDRVAAELVDDVTSVSRWREWEVELVDGNPSTLRSVGTVLRRSGGVPASSSSKLVRALDGRLPAPADPAPRKQHPKAPVSQLVEARLVDQVVELRRQDPLVRSNAPDAVHKMRVSVRRLSSALATFRPVLDRGVTEPLREELKWLARTLGAARDAEVQRARLQEMLAGESAALRRSLDRHLRDQYDQAHAACVTALESERYLALLDALDTLTTQPPWTEKAGRRTREALPGRVEREWKRLEERMDLAWAADEPAERATRLHDARRAAKRTRYAVEPVVATYGKDAKRTLKAVKKLQSVLGEHQDNVVTQNLLRDLPGQVGLDAAGSFAVGRLHAREELAAENAVPTAGKAWKRAKKAGPRRWLS